MRKKNQQDATHFVPPTELTPLTPKSEQHPLIPKSDVLDYLETGKSVGAGY